MQELRRETGKIRARSATPCNPPLMAMAALRLPCCQPGAGPCSSLTIPSPMDQTLLSTSSAGRSEAPNPLMEGNGVSTSREELPGGPEAAQGRMLSQGPELLSNSPPHSKDKVSPPSIPTHGPHCGGTKPQPNTSPPCRHQQPDHEARSSCRPRVHQAVG